MYPTISHLLNDLFGINIPLPIQTFGFWVAIAFVAAAYVVTKELKRKENEGHLSPTTSVLRQYRHTVRNKISESSIKVI